MIILGKSYLDSGKWTIRSELIRYTYTYSSVHLNNLRHERTRDPRSLVSHAVPTGAQLKFWPTFEAEYNQSANVNTEYTGRPVTSLTASVKGGMFVHSKHIARIPGFSL